MTSTIKLHSLEKTESGNLRYGNGTYPVRDLIWKDIVTLADVIVKSSKASLDMAKHISSVDEIQKEIQKEFAKLSDSYESFRKSTYAYKSKTTLSVNKNKESISNLQKSVDLYKKESVALAKKQEEQYRELNRKILDSELRITSINKNINQVVGVGETNKTLIRDVSKQTGLMIKVLFVLVIVSLFLNFII